MKVLVWQWGRHGAGPRIAAELAAAFQACPGTLAVLSLSSRAEILQGPDAPRCDLAVGTYADPAGLAARYLASPVAIPRLVRWLRAERPDLAICAMPGPLDWIMLCALRVARVPACVMVHDAIAHSGDGYPVQMLLQRWTVKAADGVIALSAYVAGQLTREGMLRRGAVLITGRHPPLSYGAGQRAFGHSGPPRLLHFGRLLPYKGLDLLAAALRLLPQHTYAMRVVGQGPESEFLNALRRIPGVTVENRWVPETQVAGLLGWADALVLPYREATQSGVAAAAVAAGRFVIATRVGGLPEQLSGNPLGILCELDASSLANALGCFLASPPPVPEGPDTAGEWQDLAATILRGMDRSAPSPTPLPQRG